MKCVNIFMAFGYIAMQTITNMKCEHEVCEYLYGFWIYSNGDNNKQVGGT